jgi:glycosyltransferase involved in cell wall biosynthesis
VRILHLTTRIAPQFGGVGPVCLGMARLQRDLGAEVAVRTLDHPREALAAAAEYELAAVLTTDEPTGPRSLGFSLRAERWAGSADAARWDLLHQHGIWQANSRVTNRWRLKTGRPTVVAPHGSLEPYGLARSVWKKRLALRAWERRNLEHAACLHATASSEADSIRAFGLDKPIAVIPNGIPSTWLSSRGDARRFRAQHGLTDDERVALFLSRVHPKKGLVMLLHAIADQRGSSSGWRFMIGGPDELGHTEELRRLSRGLGLEPVVQFIGPVYGRDKRDAFAASEVFLLPTLSENFGIVVAEALASGVPVLTTQGAPWAELESRACGWWVPATPEGITTGLQHALGQNPNSLRQMGERGRALVTERYTWEAVGRDSLLLYDWLLGNGPAPPFVRIC